MNFALLLVAFWVFLRCFLRLHWIWLLVGLPFLIPIPPLFQWMSGQLLVWVLVVLRLPQDSSEPRPTRIKVLCILSISVGIVFFPQQYYLLWVLVPLVPFHICYRDPLLRLSIPDAFWVVLTSLFLTLFLVAQIQHPYPIWGLISAFYCALLGLAQKDIRSVLLYRLLSLSALLWTFSGPETALGWTFILLFALEMGLYAFLAGQNQFSARFSGWLGRDQKWLGLASGVLALGYSPLGPIWGLHRSAVIFALATAVALLNSLGPLRVMAHLGPQPANYYPNPVQTDLPRQNPSTPES
ncbi:MAG: hypothetical protein H6510_15615 [Acidobacteria bacterium]|nr:hypothetical protein [Acidobacteriota bacterium]MCB9399242.1 hypothetical protein [Acidobacteriota bacterium]